MVRRQLIVDLDLALIANGIRAESLLHPALANPQDASAAPRINGSGGSGLREGGDAGLRFDPSSLPYRQDVLDFARDEHKKGRRIVLATSQDRQTAARIAEHLGIFDEVLSERDLEGPPETRRLEMLRASNALQDSDYVGGSVADVPIWNELGSAIVVGDSGLRDAVARSGVRVERHFAHGSSQIELWLRAIRLHQWTKNVLVFVPIFVSHQFFDSAALINSLVAFFALSLCASSTYIANDLLDLSADRAHRTKRHRPFASGSLSIGEGIRGGSLLLLAGFALALAMLPLSAVCGIGAYVATTLAYSLYFKRKLMVDLVVLASLFALRVVIGGLATGIVLSPWLLAFSIFFFLSLAFVKRYTELANADPGSSEKTGGRGYYPQDLEMIRIMGPLSGYMAILVLALYINSSAVSALYARPEWLWCVCLAMIYWISRVWFLAHRNQMPDDPVTFAFKDRISYGVGLFIVAFAALSMVG